MEDIITNLAMQKSHLGAPFELYERTWPPLDLQPSGLMAVEDSGRPDERGELRELRICGLGDLERSTVSVLTMRKNQSYKEGHVSGGSVRRHDGNRIQSYSV